MMNKPRWGLYIDIEGFSKRYEKENTVLIYGLSKLMEGIFDIIWNYYSESPNRIFAHQTGDGFLLVSEFHSKELDVPVAIAIALQRHLSTFGCFSKVSIGEGDFADITGCYSRRVMNNMDTDKRVEMGNSIMTIVPVMGSALIDSFTVMKNSPSGPLLTIRSENKSRIPKECIITDVENDIISIDWVHTKFSLVNKILNNKNLKKPSDEKINQLFTNYIQKYELNNNWVENAKNLLHLEC